MKWGKRKKWEQRKKWRGIHTLEAAYSGDGTIIRVGKLGCRGRGMYCVALINSNNAVVKEIEVTDSVKDRTAQEVLARALINKGTKTCSPNLEYLDLLENIIDNVKLNENTNDFNYAMVQAEQAIAKAGAITGKRRTTTRLKRARKYIELPQYKQ